MHKNQIALDSVQDLFDSAANAADKGLAQYFTPPAVGRALALALPPWRPVLTDLHCGDAGLLRACSLAHTLDLLGCDVTRSAGLSGQGHNTLHFTKADVTQLYPWLCRVNWQADVFALNPPFDLHQYREPLAGLAQSDCEAVRQAFAAWDGRTPRECLDSFVAALCLALDRSSEYGEGFIIGNSRTIDRLLGPDGPHAALTAHVWLDVDLGRTFSVPCRALYFARSHTRGGALRRSWTDLTPQNPALVNLRTHRQGLGPGRAFAAEQSVDRWLAARHGYQTSREEVRQSWNIYLAPDGTLRTHLNLFDEQDITVPKDEACSLHKLNGQHPLQLIFQRPTRMLLTRHACGQGVVPWRVAPEVTAAVQSALRDFHGRRAPLWPLTPVMRLGWLDEEDSIRCVKDMGNLFRAGRTYPLQAETITVVRRTKKRNLEGQFEDVELKGRELGFFIRDEAGELQLFRTVRPHEIGFINKKDTFIENTPDNRPFSQIDLTRHFHIPEIQDVATLDPERYQALRQRLQQLEALTR